MTTETLIILLIFVLSIITYLLPSFWVVAANGVAELSGSRDNVQAVENVIGKRASRATANFKETLPWAIGLLILVQVTEDTNATTALGGWIYLICRILYIPVYLRGIPYLRSILWTLSMAGLMMIALQLL